MPTKLNLGSFNDEMALGMKDKLFFLGKAPVDWVVDFGCADGRLLEGVGKFCPSTELLGVERDDDQRRLAEKRLGDKAHVSKSYVRGALMPMGCGIPTTAVLSSVLHESPRLLETVLKERFDWIVVRDMALSRADRHLEPYLQALFKAPYLKGVGRERELSERYFQLTAEHLSAPPTGYALTHYEHFIYQPTAARIAQDTGLHLTVPTHVKAIWRRTS